MVLTRHAFLTYTTLLHTSHSKQIITKQIITTTLLLNAVLGEKRFPSTLVRLIEPFVSRTTEGDSLGGKARDQNGVKKSDPLSYVEKSALSMVLFLREACIAGGREVRDQLKNMINNNNGQIPHSGPGSGISSSSSISPMYKIPLGDASFSGVGKVVTTPSVLQANLTPNTPGFRDPNTPGLRDPRTLTPYNARNLNGEFDSDRRTDDDELIDDIRNTNYNNSVSGVLNVSRLLSGCVSLRASVSMASQPSLRRLMVSGGEDGPGLGVGSDEMTGDIEFILILSDILQCLPTVRSVITATPSSSSSSSSHALELVIQAEQAVLVALEVIAQIDVLVVDCGSRFQGAKSFLQAVARKLLPAASNLSVHVGTFLHICFVFVFVSDSGAV